MIISIHKSHNRLSYRIFSAFVAFTFIFSLVLPRGYAQLVPASPAGGPQTLLNLPAPGTMVTQSGGFIAPRLIGVTVHPDNPLKFDFIVNSGDADLAPDALKEESRKLIKYFLASLTVPEDELWVNLSPYEKDHMIPQGLGDTEMGRDMLAQDYLLKQLTASLMYPEKELGQKFWEKIYKEAHAKYGTTQIPVNTFNKVWVVPQEAVVYEKGTSAYVVKSRLKVMLEKDYEVQKQDAGSRMLDTSRKSGNQNPASSIETSIIKEVILPAIEQEVNEGENFANLRQMYHSLILAAWYKLKLKDGLLGKIYIDQNKTKGIDTEDKTVNQKIYEQYLESFKKGVYNYIKEDVDPATQEMIPRKYFSGGVGFNTFVNDKVKGLGSKLLALVLATMVSEATIQPAQAAELMGAIQNDKNNRIEVVLGENPLKSADETLAALEPQSGEPIRLAQRGGGGGFGSGGFQSAYRSSGNSMFHPASPYWIVWFSIMSRRQDALLAQGQEEIKTAGPGNDQLRASGYLWDITTPSASELQNSMMDYWKSVMFDSRQPIVNRLTAGGLWWDRTSYKDHEDDKKKLLAYWQGVSADGNESTVNRLMAGGLWWNGTSYKGHEEDKKRLLAYWQGVSADSNESTVNRLMAGGLWWNGTSYKGHEEDKKRLLAYWQGVSADSNESTVNRLMAGGLWWNGTSYAGHEEGKERLLKYWQQVSADGNESTINHLTAGELWWDGTSYEGHEEGKERLLAYWKNVSINGNEPRANRMRAGDMRWHKNGDWLSDEEKATLRQEWTRIYAASADVDRGREDLWAQEIAVILGVKYPGIFYPDIAERTSFLTFLQSKIVETKEITRVSWLLEHVLKNSSVLSREGKPGADLVETSRKGVTQYIAAGTPRELYEAARITFGDFYQFFPDKKDRENIVRDFNARAYQIGSKDDWLNAATVALYHRKGLLNAYIGTLGADELGMELVRKAREVVSDLAADPADKSIQEKAKKLLEQYSDNEEEQFLASASSPVAAVMKFLPDEIGRGVWGGNLFAWKFNFYLNRITRGIESDKLKIAQEMGDLIRILMGFEGRYHDFFEVLKTRDDKDRHFDTDGLVEGNRTRILGLLSISDTTEQALRHISIAREISKSVESQAAGERIFQVPISDTLGVLRYQRVIVDVSLRIPHLVSLVEETMYHKRPGKNFQVLVKELVWAGRSESYYGRSGGKEKYVLIFSPEIDIVWPKTDQVVEKDVKDHSLQNNAGVKADILPPVLPIIPGEEIDRVVGMVKEYEALSETGELELRLFFAQKIKEISFKTFLEDKKDVSEDQARHIVVSAWLAAKYHLSALGMRGLFVYFEDGTKRNFYEVGMMRADSGNRLSMQEAGEILAEGDLLLSNGFASASSPMAVGELWQKLKDRVWGKPASEKMDPSAQLADGMRKAYISNFDGLIEQAQQRAREGMRSRDGEPFWGDGLEEGFRVYFDPMAMTILIRGEEVLDRYFAITQDPDWAVWVSHQGKKLIGNGITILFIGYDRARKSLYVVVRDDTGYHSEVSHATGGTFHAISESEFTSRRATGEIPNDLEEIVNLFPVRDQILQELASSPLQTFPTDQRIPDENSAKTGGELTAKLLDAQKGMILPWELPGRDGFIFTEILLRESPSVIVAAINEFERKMPDEDISQATGEALIRWLYQRGVLVYVEGSEVKPASSPVIASPSVAGRRNNVGTFLPLQQVRSEQDWGIGDWGVMKKAVDVHAALGQNIIQLLPFNLSSAGHSPYSLASSRLMDPNYISVESLMRELKSAGISTAAAEAFIQENRPQIKALRESNKVDYAAVNRIKMTALKMIWDSFKDRQEASLYREFEQFQEMHHNWLPDHLLYVILKNKFMSEKSNGWDWRTWDEPLRDRTPETIKESKDAHREQLAFDAFVQFVAYRQYAQLREYADSRNVEIMVDMPYALDGADIWLNPGVFGLKKENGYKALVKQGVPSEPAYPAGQYWQFFPFDWNHPDTVPFILERFQYLQGLASQVRLDHVLGYYRKYLFTEDVDGHMTLEGLGLYEKIRSLQGAANSLGTEEARRDAVKEVRELIAGALLKMRERLPEALKGHLPADAIRLTINEDGDILDDHMLLIARRVADDRLTEELPEGSPWRREKYVVEKAVYQNQSRWDFLRLTPNEAAKDRGFFYEYLFPGDGSEIKPDDSIRLGYFELIPYAEALMSEFLRLAQERGTPLIWETLGVVPSQIQKSVERLGGTNYIPVIWGEVPRWGEKRNPYYPAHHIENAFATFGLHDSTTMRNRWERELGRETKVKMLNGFFGRGRWTEEDVNALTPRVREKLLDMVYASRARIAVLTWIDLLGLGEEYRLNSPGKGGQWLNRLPREVTLENLLKAAKDEPAPKAAAEAVTLIREFTAKGVRTAQALGAEFKIAHVTPEVGGEVIQIREVGQSFLVDAYVEGNPEKVFLVLTEPDGNQERQIELQRSDDNAAGERNGLPGRWRANMPAERVGQWDFYIEARGADGQRKRSGTGRLVTVAHGADLNPLSKGYVLSPSSSPAEEEVNKLITSLRELNVQFQQKLGQLTVDSAGEQFLELRKIAKNMESAVDGIGSFSDADSIGIVKVIRSVFKHNIIALKRGSNGADLRDFFNRYLQQFQILELIVEQGKLKEIGTYYGAGDLIKAAALLKDKKEPHASSPVKAEERYVQNQWNDILKSIGVQDKGNIRFKEVVKNYKEINRHYHTLVPIASMFRIYKELKDSGQIDDVLTGISQEEVAALQLAIIFHNIGTDITYPNVTRDESVWFARHILEKLNVKEAIINRITGLIALREDYVVPAQDLLGQLFIDLRLSRFGKEEKEFIGDNKKIREEYQYGHSYAESRQERTEFIVKLSQRKPLFYHPAMQQKYEAQAQRNLRKFFELEEIEDARQVSLQVEKAAGRMLAILSDPSTFFDRISPEDDSVLVWVGKTESEESSRAREIINSLLNRRHAWLTPIYPRNGELEYLYVRLPDVHDRIEASEELRRVIEEFVRVEGMWSSPESSSPVGKVLIVDDNSNLLSDRKTILERNGHTVTTANDGAEAFQVFQESSFDLVLTDYEMPNLDGPGLISKIRAYEKEQSRQLSMPIIMVSADITDEKEEKAQELGVPLYSKVFGKGELRNISATVEEALKQVLSSPVEQNPLRQMYDQFEEFFEKKGYSVSRDPKRKYGLIELPSFSIGFATGQLGTKSLEFIKVNRDENGNLKSINSVYFWENMMIISLEDEAANQRYMRKYLFSPAYPDADGENPLIHFGIDADNRIYAVLKEAFVKKLISDFKNYKGEALQLEDLPVSIIAETDAGVKNLKIIASSPVEVVAGAADDEGGTKRLRTFVEEALAEDPNYSLVEDLIRDLTNILVERKHDTPASLETLLSAINFIVTEYSDIVLFIPSDLEDAMDEVNDSYDSQYLETVKQLFEKIWEEAPDGNLPETLEQFTGIIEDYLKNSGTSSPMIGEGQGSGVKEQGIASDAPGGIDLNPALLDLQIKRDGNGIPLPLPQQPIENMHIEGFLPIIINITPVTNLPLLLGLADTQQDTEETRPAMKAREPEEVSYLN